MYGEWCGEWCVVMVPILLLMKGRCRGAGVLRWRNGQNVHSKEQVVCVHVCEAKVPKYVID